MRLVAEGSRSRCGLRLNVVDLQFSRQQLWKQRVPQLCQMPPVRIVAPFQDWIDQLEESISHLCWWSCNQFRFEEVRGLEVGNASALV